MSGIVLGAPGSISAIDRGCSCKPADETHRAARVNVRCPFHGVVTHPSDNGADVREASPVRIGGDAWGCP